MDANTMQLQRDNPLYSSCPTGVQPRCLPTHQEELQPGHLREIR
jgi:hypothetical protein